VLIAFYVLIFDDQSCLLHISSGNLFDRVVFISDGISYLFDAPFSPDFYQTALISGAIAENIGPTV